MPYICDKNEENIGKKYRRYIFPWIVIRLFQDSNLISYRNYTNSLPMNLLDIDEMLPKCFIYQNVVNKVSFADEILANSLNILNVSQKTQNDDYDGNKQFLFKCYV